MSPTGRDAPPARASLSDPSRHLGHGVGLRTKHYPRILDGTARVDWFEVISENFMVAGGRPLAVLEQARQMAPVVLHGVSLSIGSTDPLNERYLRALAALTERIEPAWVSDHLCWGSIGGHYAHDLLPLPFTEEALNHVVERIGMVQERLGRKILIENVSSYLTFKHSTIPEWEFLSEIAKLADCGLLLDVNNVFVNSVNHGFAPEAYLAALPVGRIGQIHLAGHSDHSTHLLDTHDASVPPAVWELYRCAVERFGKVATLVEWDDQVPEWDVLCAEAEKARAIEVEVLARMRALPGQVAPAEGLVEPKGSTRGALAEAVGSGRAVLALRDLQEEVFRSITLNPGPSARAAFDSELLGFIEDCGALDAADRLDIYAQMYWMRLYDVLHDDFPHVATCLGNERFSALVARYLAQHRSRHPSVRRLGEGFAGFLAADASLDRDWPWLADLARLEWTRLAVFDAADATPLRIEDLSTLTTEAWSRLPLRPIPALRLLDCRFRVHELWSALEEGRSVEDVAAEPLTLRIWREGFTVYQATMTGAEQVAFQQVIAGGSFGQLCAALGSGVDAATAAEDAARHLLRWLEDKILVGSSVS